MAEEIKAEAIPPSQQKAYVKPPSVPEMIPRFDAAKEIHHIHTNGVRMAYFSIAAMLVVLGGSLTSFWMGSICAVIATVFFGIVAAKGILKTQHLQDKYGVAKEKLFRIPKIG